MVAPACLPPAICTIRHTASPPGHSRTCLTWLRVLHCTQDCELFYVVFDVLHDGRASLIKEPLKRRLEVLESVVLPGCDTTTKPPVPFSGSCVGGRVVALVPEKTRFGELLGSRYGSSEKDIKDALDEVAGGGWGWGWWRWWFGWMGCCGIGMWCQCCCFVLTALGGRCATGSTACHTD